MSDSLILPFSVTNYATTLRGLVQQLDVRYGSLMTSNHLSLGPLALYIIQQPLSFSLSFIASVLIDFGYNDLIFSFLFICTM